MLLIPRIETTIGWVGCPWSMESSPLDLEIHRIVTDSDLDGVVTGAILRRYWTKAEVVFGHPGQLRAGLLDEMIDRTTAICDLPMHPKCGLSIDHHQSNKPVGSNAEGCIVVWEESPSAARIAFEVFSESLDLSDLNELLHWVDKLDGGGISREDFLSENPALLLSRVIDSGEDIAMRVLEFIQDGVAIEDILSDYQISSLVEEKRIQMESLSDVIRERMEVHDRLALVRLDGLGIRSNGYHVTAMAGDECDACVIIHGDIGASFGDTEGYPLSASFYTNSFLHLEGGIFDLTRLATRFDPDGGGHANACGCRIKPIGQQGIEDRQVSEEDIERNVEVWKKMWSKR